MNLKTGITRIPAWWQLHGEKLRLENQPDPDSESITLKPIVSDNTDLIIRPDTLAK